MLSQLWRILYRWSLKIVCFITDILCIKINLNFIFKMDSFKPHNQKDLARPNNPDNIWILYLRKKPKKTLPTLTFYKVIFLKLLALSMKIRGRGSSKKIWNANPVWVTMGWNKFWLRILILSLFLTICTVTVMSRNTSCLKTQFC